jgi:hypothetical protein
MMGRLNHDQGRLFYSFCLEEAVFDDHLVRKVAAVLDLSWVHAELAPQSRSNSAGRSSTSTIHRCITAPHTWTVELDAALQQPSHWTVDMPAASVCADQSPIPRTRGRFACHATSAVSARIASISLNRSSASLTICTSFRLIGPQCLRMKRSPTAVLSTANCGHSLQRS